MLRYQDAALNQKFFYPPFLHVRSIYSVPLEAAGEFNESPPLVIFVADNMLGFFQYGRDGRRLDQVCCIPVQWALYPCKLDDNRAVDGAALDSSSADDLQPGCYCHSKSPTW